MRVSTKFKSCAGDKLKLPELACLIMPADSEEVISIISSLTDNKPSGPNSIPTRILKLLKKDFSI